MPAQPPKLADAAIAAHRATRQIDDHIVLDLALYVPYFFASVNNALSASASTAYRQEFGIGITEWRVLSTLAQEPGAFATDIVSLLALDKAAVSRALSGLAKLGKIEPELHPKDPRRKSWTLTDKGWRIHNEILAKALEREDRLLKGVSAKELEMCLKAMKQMQTNLFAERAENNS